MSGKLRNRLNIAASYFRHKAVLGGGPIEITLESTAKCNLYCPMCPRHIYTFDNENMDLELYRKIVEDCKDYVEFITRPGLFAYGRLDDGTRSLLDVLEARPGERIVDLGCGCGVAGELTGIVRNASIEFILYSGVCTAMP